MLDPMETPTELCNRPADSSAGVKEQFYRYFQQECTQLQEQIDNLESYSLVAGEKQDAIDHVLMSITRLSNDVLDTKHCVTAYDQRIYCQAIKALEEKLQQTRNRIAPKPRFQFKTKQKNNSALSISDAAQIAAIECLHPAQGKARDPIASNESMATTPASLVTPQNETDSLGELSSFPKNYNEEMTRGSSSIRKPSFSQAIDVDISGHHGLHIILPSSASRATSSGNITRLNGCIVDMSAPTSRSMAFAGLAMRDIKNSLVIAGRVAGAAHMTGIEDSIIVVTSRQVRIHNCKNMDIYLHSASRPIIEDCANIKFSPLPNCYMTATEAQVQNQWDQVDDFKWLKAEHSPNWSILPEEKRLGETVWTEIVPGQPGIGLGDILKKLSLGGSA